MSARKICQLALKAGVLLPFTDVRAHPREEKATYRPFPLMLGRSSGPLQSPCCCGLAATETNTVRGVHEPVEPVQVSRQYTASAPCVAAPKLVAVDAKATYLPLELKLAGPLTLLATTLDGEEDFDTSWFGYQNDPHQKLIIETGRIGTTRKAIQRQLAFMEGSSLNRAKASIRGSSSLMETIHAAVNVSMLAPNWL
jgi:hypothetical protein